MATGGKSHVSFSQGSEEHFTLACLPCHRDNIAIPAYGYCIDCHEHLCQVCYKHHKRATLSRYHNLLDKDTMPTTQKLTVPYANVGTADNLTIPCLRHKTEIIKLYCHDHAMLLCSICATLEHNKACHVDYIPEIAENTLNDRDYRHTIGRIDKLMNKCNILKTEVSRCSNKSGNSLKDALQDIKIYRQEINRRLDQLQQEIEVNVQNLQYENDEKMKLVTSKCEDVLKTMRTTHDRIKRLNKKLQANKLFMETKQFQTQLDEHERSITTLTTRDIIDEYEFIPDQSILDELGKEKMIGDILVKHNAMTDTSSQSSLPASEEQFCITPTCLGEVCVKTTKDLHRCCIHGMTMLPPNRLILGDRNSQSIKLVDVSSNSVTSQHSLGPGTEDMPSDITSVTNTEVAVTVPDRQHIQFISVSEKLNKSRTMQTDGECYGICCHQNKLVVTYCNPGKLEILDMTGTVTTRVESTGADVFDRPIYVHANNRYIYITDNGFNEVIMLNWNGEIIGKIGGFKYLWGLEPLGNDEGILVSDCDDNSLYQISSDCTSSRHIVQDVRCPLVLCLDEEERKLYISRGTRNDPNINNNILVYNI